MLMVVHGTQDPGLPGSKYWRLFARHATPVKDGKGEGPKEAFGAFRGLFKVGMYTYMYTCIYIHVDKEIQQ